jgi:hypothetical protein
MGWVVNLPAMVSASGQELPDPLPHMDAGQPEAALAGRWSGRILEGGHNRLVVLDLYPNADGSRYAEAFISGPPDVLIDTDARDVLVTDRDVALIVDWNGLSRSYDGIDHSLVPADRGLDPTPFTTFDPTMMQDVADWLATTAFATTL